MLFSYVFPNIVIGIAMVLFLDLRSIMKSKALSEASKEAYRKSYKIKGTRVCKNPWDYVLKKAVEQAKEGMYQIRGKCK